MAVREKHSESVGCLVLSRAGLPSSVGHSPWMRAVRRIHTWASIIVSMRCRGFFVDFMPRILSAVATDRKSRFCRMHGELRRSLLPTAIDECGAMSS
jgi:hypothetical protein